MAWSLLFAAAALKFPILGSIEYIYKSFLMVKLAAISMVLVPVPLVGFWRLNFTDEEWSMLCFNKLYTY